MSAGRLELDDAEPGCYMTADDLLTVVRTLVDNQIVVAERLAGLLNGDAGRTLSEMALMLDVPVLDIAYAFAYLSQVGAIITCFEVAGGEQGYKLIGWAE